MIISKLPLRILREYFIVTLACEAEKQFEAHEIVIASSNPLFQTTSSPTHLHVGCEIKRSGGNSWFLLLWGSNYVSREPRFFSFYCRRASNFFSSSCKIFTKHFSAEVKMHHMWSNYHVFGMKYNCPSPSKMGQSNTFIWELSLWPHAMCMIVGFIDLSVLSCRFDSRLKFRGLKEMEHKNWVTKDENIWKPQIRCEQEQI